VIDDVFVPINSDVDIVTARHNGRAMAAELGFQTTDLTLIATAISELARNIVRYAHHGEIRLQVIDNQNGKRGLLIEARDEGPGIANVARALQDGYSTSGGLGLGLPGTRRLMDEFEIVSSPESGTTVRTKKWLRSSV
jgi:serine/threonine-protein kinase RsbT